MSKSLFSPPDSFSLSPLLALLPVKGAIGDLGQLTSSFYARYEKVRSMLRSLGPNRQGEALQRLSAEEGMLKQVLDWLAVRTDEPDVE